MGNVKTVVDDGKVRLSTKQTGAAGTHFDAGLSEEDKARVAAYRQMYYDAKERGDSSAMAAAHEAAEHVRAGYGYSGGADGSEYIPLQHKQELTVPEFTFGTQVEDYSPYLQQMYTAKKQAAMAELKSAYDNSMAELNRAESGLAGTYQAARNETAGAHEQERRNFAQFAAANGLNNGTAGQAELARGVTLQNNMNTIRTAEASAVADLTLQRAQAETEYNAAIAQAEYTGEYELAAALYEEKVRVQNALIEQEARRYQLEYQAYRDKVGDSQWQKSFDQNAAQQEWQNRFDEDRYTDAQAEQERETLASYGASYLQAGVMPSAEMLAAMGISEADAQAYINNYQSNESKSQNESRKKTLASYGASYLEAGVMPSAEMLAAMGITEADAQAYINNTAVKNADGANYTMVSKALTDMVRAGANMTELRSALRGAWNEGVLTQVEYEQLCRIYLPEGWRT